jgi:hypothetical protein
VLELNGGITKEHLIDDYALSRNIAKFGLKATSVLELLPQIGLSDANFFKHGYILPTDQKVERMKRIIRDWDLRTRQRRRTKEISKPKTSSQRKMPKGGGS